MIFRRALVRLTVAYSAIQLGLFALAALAIYVFVSLTFDFDVVTTDGGAVGADPAAQALNRLRTALIVVYAALLVVVPLVSYLMARVALAPLRRSYERQQQFVDATSHEFRTPLGVIVGELSLALMRPRDGAAYRAAIQESLNAAEGLASLTNQLLLLSRDDRAELSAEREPIAVADLVADAVAAAGVVSHRVTVSCPTGLTVWGSRDLLVHAVRNVVDNAVKYCVPADPIDVTAAARGASVAIVVSDAGRGMSSDEARNAFDRFWRAPSARSVPGHGIGLSLVRQIVEAHGGRVQLTSTPGTGTVVTLTLPG